MRFKGKNGWIMWLTLALVLGVTGWFWSLRGEFHSQVEFWGLTVLFTAVALFIIFSMVRNDVTVTDTEIVVRLGMITTSIDIASVVSMKKVVSLTASSGASSRRLEIVYRNGGERKIYISTADRDSFITAVLSRSPKIKIY